MNLIRRALLSIKQILLAIFGEDSYIGKNFLLTAKLGKNQVYPSWSITSGGDYASINQNGKVTITSGADNNQITVQVVYNNQTVTKDIIVSYDNQLTIEASDTITGTSGNCIARYNSEVVTPTWSITSGNGYATIDNSGNITILSSGNITVSATYTTYSATKNIQLVYDAGTSSNTVVNDDGSVTTEITTTVENQDGSTTTTSTISTVNDDGSTSNTESETVTNQDGSSTTTATTTNSDGTSSESETTVSAPDENGSVTSNSTTTNYDENGDISGSSENETVINTDGSSSSTTTNFDENGDPTDQENKDTDTSGNINTQNIEYDENGDEVVTGYNIDTTNNPDGEKNYNLDGVNTEFYGFDTTRGFILNFHFIIDTAHQPANQHQNHHNILTMKRATPEPWYGLQIRQSGTNKYIQLGTQFGKNTNPPKTDGGNTNTTISPSSQNKVNGSSTVLEYDITITYNPTASTNKFVCVENLSNRTLYTQNKIFPDVPELRYLTICIGYAQDENGDPYRYSNIDVINFSVVKTS